MIEYIKSLKPEEIAGLIALVISLFSIVYTYKGIKHSKYVETITDQRIKWIDTLRNDFSKVLTLAVLLRRFNDSAESAEYFEETNEYYELEPEDRYEVDEEISEIRKKRKILIKESTDRETINTIELAILRLNENDDKVLIDKLEVIKNGFLKKEYDKITDKFVENLRYLIKELLKKEWERVKFEVRKGGFVNVKGNKTKKTDTFWN